MSNIVLQVEDLWKQYRLGVIGSGSMRNDLARFWANIRGKEDPTLKIGETNNRASIAGQHVWALQDINFEVKQGEVLGIIGKNGAGKSTLLKILSKVTAPTKGKIRVRGRIASLLEVGTGFHPELTGRENIFLNGAILGMTKNDIRSKFEEIVEFSGIGKYIDTPVKRYSSGMYVRLAFAVAAHLEPEILIIDEVLAVGDVEFQKKCLGKMKDVAGEGRTVLFVSHNMVALKSLCDKAIWISKGNIVAEGNSLIVINNYLKEYNGLASLREIDLTQEKNFSNEFVTLRKVAIESKNELIRVSDEISIYFEFECLIEDADLNMSLVLYTRDDVCVLNTGSKIIKSGLNIFYSRCYIPANFLNDEFYRVRILIIKSASVALVDIHDIICFEVSDSERKGGWMGKWIGIVRPELAWDFNLKSN